MEPRDGRFTERNGRVCREEACCQECAKEYASGKHKVPRFRFPVVLQKVEVVGDAGGTDVTKRRADPKGAVQQDEVQWHHQSDDGSSHVPRPRLTDPFDNCIHGREGNSEGHARTVPRSHRVTSPSRHRPFPKGNGCARPAGKRVRERTATPSPSGPSRGPTAPEGLDVRHGPRHACPPPPHP